MSNAQPNFSIGGSQIAAGSTHDYTFKVVPAVPGHNTIVCPLGPLDSSWAGLIWQAFISATNQLTVRIANVTSSPITPAVQGFTTRTFVDAGIV